MKTLLKLGVFVLMISGISYQLSTGNAQGTAFTYQGRLNDGANLANGLYDITYTSYGVASGGTSGSVRTNLAVGVTNGLFLITLDFGAVPSGSLIWLELSVRTNGGGAFTTLAPRQQLTPAPYALFANTASNLVGTLPTSKLTGSVANSQLTSSTITVNAGTGLSGGGTVALGGSTTLNNAGVLSVVGNSDITANTTNGVVTLGTTASSASVTDTLVKRDGNGSFNAYDINVLGDLNLPYGNLNFYQHFFSVPTKIQVIDPFFINQHGLLVFSEDNFFAGLDAGNQTNFSANFFNTGIGSSVLHNLTFGGANTAVGYSALSANTIGEYNSALGYSALLFNTNGSYNTAVGNSALKNNVSGDNNSAFGNSALVFNGSGQGNTAVGDSAMNDNTNGNQNTAVGQNALQSNASGSQNTAVGATTLGNSTAGFQNIALGYGAGYSLTNGSFNIAIGNIGVAKESSTIRIGTPGTHTNTFIAGVINGNGGGLTNLNASQISGGIYAGNGGSLTNVNAAQLNGLSSTSFALASGSTNYIQNQTATVQNASFQISGNATSIGTNITGALVVSNNAQISGLLRSGSETGTSEPPNPAGLIIRRINSTVLSSNVVVAVSRGTNTTAANVVLVRDGTQGGFQIKYPANPGNLTIACMGIDSTGVQKNFYSFINNPATAGTVQIYTNSQNIVHFECTFGNTYDIGYHLTQVNLSRYGGDYYWSGNLISTYNQ